MKPATKSLQDLLMAQSIPIAFLEDVVEGVGVASDSGKAVLAAEGLTSSQLAISGHRLSVIEYSGFVKHLMAESDDLFLGFLDNPIPRQAFGVFAIGGVGSRSLTALVDYGNLFFSLFTDQFSWEIRREPGLVRLILRLEERRTISYRFIYQSILLIWLRLVSWFVGEELRPRAVRFSFPEKNIDSHLRYLFGDAIEFSSQSNEIAFDERAVDVPFTGTQEEIRLMLRDNQNMMLIRNSAEPFTKQTRRLLVLNREERWLTQSEIAKTLGLSENLYWRKLKKEGTTYKLVLNGLKRDFALRLLADPNHSVESVGAQLHFSELSAFNKAFKKWTGMTPGRYRVQLIEP